MMIMMFYRISGFVRKNGMEVSDIANSFKNRTTISIHDLGLLLRHSYDLAIETAEVLVFD